MEAMVWRVRPTRRPRSAWVMSWARKRSRRISLVRTFVGLGASAGKMRPRAVVADDQGVAQRLGEHDEQERRVDDRPAAVLERHDHSGGDRPRKQHIVG